MSNNGDTNSSWLEQRSRIYAALSSALPQQADNVVFKYHRAQSGTINLYLLVWQKINYLLPLTAQGFVFSSLRNFLENIIRNDLSLENNIRVNTNTGPTSGIFFYEHLKQLGGADHGVFGLYNWYSSQPIYAFCNTKHFVKSLYLSTLYYLGVVCAVDESFPDEWLKHSHYNDVWEVYNDFKSDLVEWYIYSEKPYREVRPSIAPGTQHPVSYTLTMNNDSFLDSEGYENSYGDECICIGDWDVSLSNTLVYNFLYAIAFNIECEDGDENNLSHEVLDLTWEGAMRLRKILPDDVDLFCHSWDPNRPTARLGYIYQFPRLIIPRGLCL